MATATVNYSVPEKVKREFNKTFKSENKSLIITHLMEKAIEERKIQQQRKKAIDNLLNLRKKMPKASNKKIAKVRAKDRT